MASARNGSLFSPSPATTNPVNSVPANIGGNVDHLLPSKPSEKLRARQISLIRNVPGRRGRDGGHRHRRTMSKSQYADQGQSGANADVIRLAKENEAGDGCPVDDVALVNAAKEGGERASGGEGGTEVQVRQRSA